MNENKEWNNKNESHRIEDRYINYSADVNSPYNINENKNCSNLCHGCLMDDIDINSSANTNTTYNNQNHYKYKYPVNPVLKNNTSVIPCIDHHESTEKNDYQAYKHKHYNIKKVTARNEKIFNVFEFFIEAIDVITDIFDIFK